MLKTILSCATAAGLAFSVLAAPVAANADDLETIKAASEFKFANSGAYPPFSFVDDSNQTVGFDVDIGNEIAKRGVDALLSFPGQPDLSVSQEADTSAA